MQLVTKIELTENGAPSVSVYQESKYAIGDTVSLRLSKETGEVTGIAFYRDATSRTPHYHVTYVNAMGIQRTDWIDELDLL
mgnify:CR=1 FL=1